MNIRYFISQAPDRTWCVVEHRRRKEWEEFVDLPADDERSWFIPVFATPLARGVESISFENPIPEPA